MIKRVCFILVAALLLCAAPLTAQSASLATFMDEMGPTYAWHTFYPGSSAGNQVVTAGDGSIYIIGKSMDFQGPNGEAPLHPFTPGMNSQDTDVLVLKLDPDGEYLWHTFWGSPGPDLANAATIDSDGNLYITGESAES